MNILDFVILIPLVYFCYRGGINGFIGEVFGIAAICLGVYVTFHYMDDMATLIAPLFDGRPNYLPFVAATIVFLGTLIVVQIVAELLRRFVSLIKLNALNRLLGMAFGALKGGIVISAILLLLAGFNLPSQQSRQDSLSYSYVIYLAPWAYNVVGSDEFSGTIRQTLRKYTPIENFPIAE